MQTTSKPQHSNVAVLGTELIGISKDFYLLNGTAVSLAKEPVEIKTGLNLTNRDNNWTPQ